jgi:RNA polymerase sigma-54 factor
VVAKERRPLTDTELAAELTRAGFPVARRTVAKYRDRLGIPAQALR